MNNKEPTKEQSELAKLVDHACREHGFTYIQNWPLAPQPPICRQQ